MKQSSMHERSLLASFILNRRKSLLAGVVTSVVILSSMAASSQTSSERTAALLPVLQLLLLDTDGDVPLPDRDGDGVPDRYDDFPDDPEETHDTDGDGIGDNADPNPNFPDSLVITDATDAGNGLYLSWISAYSDDCRVLYGPTGARPAEGLSDTSEFYVDNVDGSGQFKVLVECYDDNGSSTFSLPALVEIP